MKKKDSNRSFKKGFKYEFYPTDDQKVLMDKTFGCCRYVWNHVLDDVIKQYELFKVTNSPKDKPDLSEFGLVKRIAYYKANPDSLWLSEVSYCALQMKLHHLSKAFKGFFKLKSNYPKFKKRNQKQSFTLIHSSNAFRCKERKWYIVGSKEPLDIYFDRSLPSSPTSCTISKSTTGHYYISFTCEYTPKTTNGKGIIGIDLGLKDFIVTSDGLRFSNPKHLSKHEKNLKRKKQDLARCQKGSKRREKARIKVAKVYEKIANQRNDFLHQLSRKLINENQIIGIENLCVKNMVKNRKLSKSIHDVSWSKFIQYLIYKSQESQHCNIVKMDSFYPSTHICNCCKTKLDYKLKLSERNWTCPSCHSVNDRDINAALNIRDEAVIANVNIIKGALILNTNRYPRVA